ncbi:hypothetical protein CCHR01_11894 [Colletotrichum chrysophilum]|uniref:Uncharacterized protein n=1 Tax=Colletotrichum chrysophilum TaxID=1836956 RepID=A0AAD9EHZ1_9PEZI|nr:hypothetical protein CCHR01_11894 [Colletotrichum chrysophilum]
MSLVASPRIRHPNTLGTVIARHVFASSHLQTRDDTSDGKPTPPSSAASSTIWSPAPRARSRWWRSHVVSAGIVPSARSGEATMR